MTGEGAARQPSEAASPDHRSYYGRPVLKPPVWSWEVPAYLFTGGLAAGSAVLGAGGDLRGRPGLRRAGRLGALAAVAASGALLAADLGRPERFHHMLRVAKPTSPLSVGTWILTAFGAATGAAAAGELLPWGWVRPLARLGGVGAAATAPGLASYTAVLLSGTAAPAWHEAHRYLPFVFTGSAAASGGGLGMMLAPVAEAGPARRFAALGAGAELVTSRLMPGRLGLAGEAYTTGMSHRLRSWSERLTAVGLVGTVLGARRSRVVAVASGLALLAGSALQRFGVFEAGVASTLDPKYTVIPQRDRLEHLQRIEQERGAAAGSDA